MKKVYDIIIIGGGPAGYSAALYSARAGLDTLVIEKMGAGGQMALTDVIDNYPGFDGGVDGFSLGMKMQTGAERFGAKTEYGEVSNVDFSDKIKRISVSGEDYLAKAVIIATGAGARTLGLKNEEELTGRGVHYCAHCDGRFYEGKTVAVVGGGNSAVSDALYLSRLCKKVYLIHRRDTLRADKIYKDALVNRENVEFVWNSEVLDLFSDTRLSGVKIKNIKSGECKELSLDGLFISVGRIPKSELFKGKLALDESSYIVADETTETSIPGVFAAGDVRTKELRQVVTAVSDGAVSVHFAEKYLEKCD